MRHPTHTRCAKLLLALALAAQGFAAGARASDLPAQDDARGGGAAQTLVAEGASALARGDEAGARESFEKALRADPNNVEAHTYLGVLADRAGDLSGAEKHFAAAAALAPFSASARNNYGAILVRLNKLQLAAAQFEASLKLDRDQPNALVNLAQIRFNSGKAEDLGASRELFERAMRVAPDAEIARAVVVISLRLGEKERAAAAYKDYAAQVAAAAQPDASAVNSASTQSASTSNASSAASRAELGEALLESGLVEESTKELTAATALDPSNADAVIALARGYLKLKDIRSAGRTLESAVARGLDPAPVYAALADVYEAGGYTEHAIPAMRLAIARDPHNELYRLRYGILLNDTKAPEAAVIRLKEALQEFPNSSRLWLALGIAEQSDGKNEDAQKSFERSLSLDSASAPALAYLGSTYAERGQYAEAVSFYERAIAADPKLSVPYFLAADALLKQPETDAPRVEKYLARAIELDPNFAEAHLALARLDVRAERWPEAAAEFERAIKLDPQSAEAHYQLARVYVRLKRTDEAQRELAEFKQLSDAQKEKRETDRRDLLRRLANVRF
ncbi:MAG TPA: tetratricopeptide repeat protein [Pyrinomonadaceae bacterium]|nr:tetratricopeptide repeat protein [Pyrinomonadaceae bacterium]